MRISNVKFPMSNVQSICIAVLILLFLFSIHYLSSTTHAQTVCSPTAPIRVTNGLISAQQITPGSRIGTDAQGRCIIDPQAAFALFKIPTYEELKTVYFTENKNGTVKSTTITSMDQIQPGDGVYETGSNDLTVNSLPQSAAGVVTIFVGGDLYITLDRLIYGLGTEKKGLVFIVKGDINILPNVTRIDAVLISAGTICTAYEGAGCSGFTDPFTTQALAIKGSLIALNPLIPNPIKFRRFVSGLAASETITYEPKYIPILDNTISSNLSITTEDTNYSINLDSTATPPPSTATLNVNPLENVQRGQNVTVSWANVQNLLSQSAVYLYFENGQNKSWIARLYMSGCSESASPPASPPSPTGSCTFEIPSFLPAGNYQFRVLNNPNDNSETPILQSFIVRVIQGP